MSHCKIEIARACFVASVILSLSLVFTVRGQHSPWAVGFENVAAPRVSQQALLAMLEQVECSEDQRLAIGREWEEYQAAIRDRRPLIDATEQEWALKAARAADAEEKWDANVSREEELAELAEQQELQESRFRTRVESYLTEQQRVRFDESWLREIQLPESRQQALFLAEKIDFWQNIDLVIQRVDAERASAAAEAIEAVRREYVPIVAGKLRELRLQAIKDARTALRQNANAVTFEDSGEWGINGDSPSAMSAAKRIERQARFAKQLSAIHRVMIETVGGIDTELGQDLEVEYLLGALAVYCRKEPARALLVNEWELLCDPNGEATEARRQRLVTLRIGILGLRSLVEVFASAKRDQMRARVKAVVRDGGKHSRQEELARRLATRKGRLQKQIQLLAKSLNNVEPVAPEGG